ncbi:MAG: hypothetical protein J6P40_04395 [Oscillospiraceae bacterium]|nr:hypothetical protein [Oscillospiraceae bacterium]
MAEYLTRDRVETVALNSPIPFVDSIPCNRGLIYHQSGTGIFTLRGKTTNCFARYEIEFTGNIAIPEEGEVTPIATAIVVSGEQRIGSRSIFTPADVDEYGNVTSRATVDVPCGCCFNVSVEYVSGIVDDPTVTPTPFINVIDGSLSIARTA